jgi:GT2 family glycosyltransferase
VRVAVDHDDFVRALREALVEVPAKSIARRAEAEGHSWQARVEQIERIMHEADRRFAITASTGESRPALSVIVISYNTRGMTLSCLRTLGVELHGSDAEILLVDNASHDGSVDAVRTAFPHVRVIASATNVGFGAANNLAMKAARGRFFLLLNSDAFPKPGAVAALMQYLETHPKVGAVGPRLLNEDGSMQLSCFRFPTPRQAWFENLWISSLFPTHAVLGNYRRWAHDSERLVDWIGGACMLVRREVVEQVGGFDERFFLYAEETDWQRRMRDGGWEIAFTPLVEVTHLGGASGASTKTETNRHFFDSLDRYERKHHGLAGLLSLRGAMIAGCGMRAILWALTWLLRPRRRALAGAKARLHSWLVLRQATHRL